MLGLATVLVAGSWYFAWKCYQYASHAEASNAFFLKERNQLVEKLAQIYFKSTQIDALIEKLGISTSLMENNLRPLLEENIRAGPFSERLNETSGKEIASLLLIQNTPLDIGTAMLPLVFPRVETKTKRTLANAEALHGKLEKIKLDLNTMPTIAPAGGRLKSFFGTRIHPVLHTRAFHSGIDIGAQAGSPVIATAEGRVLLAKNKGGYGKTVVIRHSDTFKTKYSHLKRLEVKAGQRVSRGEVIGFVGSTGLSTGPHLHYEVHIRDRPTDPLQFIFN